MTVKEMLRKEDMKKLTQLKKTYEADRGDDPNWDSDICAMIRKLENKLGL